MNEIKAPRKKKYGNRENKENENFLNIRQQPKRALFPQKPADESKSKIKQIKESDKKSLVHFTEKNENLQDFKNPGSKHIKSFKPFLYSEASSIFKLFEVFLFFSNC